MGAATWLQPQVKLLLMLREPSQRYYSAYWYYNKRYAIYERYGPLGAAAFARMAEADVKAFTRCREGPSPAAASSATRGGGSEGRGGRGAGGGGHTARRCARRTFHEAQQLVKGLYSLFLEPWLG